MALITIDKIKALFICEPFLDFPLTNCVLFFNLFLIGDCVLATFTV